MADLKEIKSVKIVPFTLMNASITAIMGFIYAIVIILLSGIISTFLPPELSGVIISIGASMLVLLPVGGFLLQTLWAFLTALFYNALVPKLGGIKLEFEEDIIKKVPVVSFALITSTISAIWAFISGLILAAIIIPLPGFISAIPTITGNATAIPNVPEIGLLWILIPILIIGWPIAAFISSFIGYAVIALIYNFIVAKIGGIRLELSQTVGKFSTITFIPVLALAIALAILMAICNFIFEIPNFLIRTAQGDVLTGLMFLVGYPIGYLALYFIMGALFAILYNFLRPKIGGVKLELE